MDTDIQNQASTLEARLERLERQTKRRKMLVKRFTLGVAIFIVFLGLIMGGWLIYKQSTSVSHRLSALHAGFTLYAPPGGTTNDFTLDPSTITNQNGFVTYSLKNGSKSITLTQQSLPSPPPDLTKLSGFTKTTTSLGKGVVGSSGEHQIAIVVARETLVNVTASQGVTLPTLSAVVGSLHKITP